MLANARRWRAPLSLGLGLPLLLGSTPAAAAGAGGILVGGLTPWVGIAAALWAVLASGGEGVLAGGGGLAFLLAFGSLTAWWAWRHQRTRFFASRRPACAPSPQPAASTERSAWPMALDGEQVLDAARSRFFRLQAAWDAGDVAALGHLTTPEMLEQLLSVLTARGSAPNRTDIVSLHAELLAVEEVSAAYLASVEFSGLIRESAEEGTVPFRELWMLAAAKDGSQAWRLARQQALF